MVVTMLIVTVEQKFKGGLIFFVEMAEKSWKLATLAVAGADMPVRNTARAKRQERQDVACRYGKGGGGE